VSHKRAFGNGLETAVPAVLLRKALDMQPLVAQAFAPAEIRTQNLLIRSQMLYPVELRVRIGWEGYRWGNESQGVGSGEVRGGKVGLASEAALRDRCHFVRAST
jgi:hypothetical protein